MNGYPLILCDARRAKQFPLMGHGRQLFRDYDVRSDDSGITWAWSRYRGHGFAVTWLGPGWVFDRHARERRAERYAARLAAMQAADEMSHEHELEQVVRRLRLGRHSERLLWAVHLAVLRARTSVVRLPDFWLAQAVWGRDRRRWPQYWRRALSRFLEDLTWIHLTEWVGNPLPPLGEATALLTHVAGLRGGPKDECMSDCPGRNGPRHHHYLISVGRGLLGELEQFALPASSTGVRNYALSFDRPSSVTGTSRGMITSEHLVPFYLPAKLGEPSACSAFTARQLLLLQTIVRATTRATKQDPHDSLLPRVATRNPNPSVHGQAALASSFPSPEDYSVGFKVSKKAQWLTREGGWLAKARYLYTGVEAFLEDLAALAGPLGLVVVGLHPSGYRRHDLSEMRVLATSADGRRKLEKLHVQIHPGEGYPERWNEAFGWQG